MADDEFDARNRMKIAEMGQDRELHEVARQFLLRSARLEYSYHFRWLGLPIIQYPQDIIALQELIWKTQPDAIIETGIARGGSVIFHASMLHLIGRGGRVIGVDVDIRPDNRRAIEAHPLARYIELVSGSSVANDVIEQVRQRVKDCECVLVILDSMHTHAHVLAELRAYAPLVTAGSYLVVLDTCVEHLPAELFPERPWGRGNNPWTAVQEFLRESDRFEIDHTVHDKLQITVAPDGYLRCIKD